MWTLGAVLRRIALPFLVALGLAAPAAAHEIPARVALQGYVVPLSDRVQVALRLPLAALRDVDFPLRADGTLDLTLATPRLDEALRTWVLPSIRLDAGSEPLGPWRLSAWRVVPPSDRAFASWTDARAGFAAGSPSAPMRWQEASIDVLLEVTGAVAPGVLALTPTLAHLGVRTSTVLTLVLPDGGERTMRYVGNPGRVALDPSWVAAALRFVRQGVEHIWGGLDHLLFVLCLVLPIRGWRPLVAIVTAFTVAHSVTLGAAAMGFVPQAGWFPPLVEFAIAASIVWMAVENVLLPTERLERRWPMAFGFGLVHGFGFAFALGDALQFAGRHLVTALAAFNLGIELGQLAVLALAVPALAWIARRASSERALVVVGSVLIGHTAWHWMTARGAALAEYEVSAPTLDAHFWLVALRLAFVAVLSLGLAWALRAPLRRLLTAAPRATGLALVCGFALVGSDLGAQSPTRSTAEGVYTVQQAQRGKDVFAGACQSCHDVNAHAGPAFRTNWTGRTLDALFEFLRASMPKSDPGTLSDVEYVDVMAFLLRQNRMPAGGDALVPDSSVLAKIRFDTTSVPNGATPRHRR
jgi:mono/diheme cytochrome c family protein